MIVDHTDYFHGDTSLDDIALEEEGLNRLGNVIVPNECYGEILENIVLPWLSEIEDESAQSLRQSLEGVWNRSFVGPWETELMMNRPCSIGSQRIGFRS